MNEKFARSLKKYYDHIIFLRMMYAMPDIDMDIMYYDMVNLYLEQAGLSDKREEIEQAGANYVEEYISNGIRTDLERELLTILNNK